jgi:hypothetical protein
MRITDIVLDAQRGLYGEERSAALTAQDHKCSKSEQIVANPLV